MLQAADLLPTENVRSENVWSNHLRPEDVCSQDLRSEDVRSDHLCPQNVRTQDLRTQDVRTALRPAVQAP